MGRCPREDARAPSRTGGATRLDDDDGVDDDDDDGDETVEIDACDRWTRARATGRDSRPTIDDGRRGTHHVR